MPTLFVKKMKVLRWENLGRDLETRSWCYLFFFVLRYLSILSRVHRVTKGGSRHSWYKSS